MMPTSMSLTGCATGRAEDTTTARSYRTSSAEHERIDLRHEFYWTRAFKLKSTMTTRGPHQWIQDTAEQAVSRARMKRDPAYFIARTGRRPWAKQWHWETLKSNSGYDALRPRTVLAHVLYCWDYWLSATHIPKKHDRRYAEALVLARRVLRRWGHWTVCLLYTSPSPRD